MLDKIKEIILPERAAFRVIAVVESLATLAIVLVCLIVERRILSAIFGRNLKPASVWRVVFQFVSCPRLSVVRRTHDFKFSGSAFFVRNAFWMKNSIFLVYNEFKKGDKINMNYLKLSYLGIFDPNILIGICVLIF